MGKNIVHCGDVGTGGTVCPCLSYCVVLMCQCVVSIHFYSLSGVAKLCNNLSLAISMIGTCEAMNLVRNNRHHHHQFVFYD